jgi:hypothetical protein
MIISSDFTDRPVEPGLDNKAAYIMHRTADGTVYTNVPHHVVHHSHTGYEWGYSGSGPADLALNMVQDALSRMDYKDPFPPVDCYQGRCMSLAWRLHQRFKEAFIAKLPRDGGVFSFQDVAAWIADRPEVPDAPEDDSWMFPSVGPEDDSEDYF